MYLHTGVPIAACLVAPIIGDSDVVHNNALLRHRVTASSHGVESRHRVTASSHGVESVTIMVGGVMALAIPWRFAIGLAPQGGVGGGGGWLVL